MANESIIKLFDGNQVRIFWNEQEEKYYFAVADIVQVLTDSADVKQYIKRMRSRDKELDSVWGAICTPLAYQTIGGKQKINFADLQGIFRIIQSIPSKKAVPVKQWLAELGQMQISVITKERASDYILPEQEQPKKDVEELPFGE